MNGQSVSTGHIDYLEKDFLDNLRGKINVSSLNISEIGEARFLKINEISNFWELHEKKFISLRFFMEDIISGLYEGNIPLIFAIFGKVDKVEIVMGTYARRNQSAEDNLETMKTSLKSSFQGIGLKEQAPDYLKKNIDRFDFAGLITGTPTEKIGVEKVGIEQIERMIRGLYGREWGYLVIATPATNSEINSLFNTVLNEIRIVINSEKSTGIESPIGKRYKELLQVYLNKLQLAKAQGMWHTVIFLFSADHETLNHVKAVAKSALGGRESLPDRIRSLEFDGKISNPGLILNPPPDPPGRFKYLYNFMNATTSADLANFVHIPSQEMPGFQIKPYARFNVSTDVTEGKTIRIGEVLDQGDKMGISYRISLKNLKKHGLIAGTTGSGKTNTSFYMLLQLWESKIPFLVLEPAKTEYRALLTDEKIGPDLRIFTLGHEQVSPFRLNPFEVEPTFSVSTHIDLLKSVFNASFGMWTPLPQVLERCIHAIYQDKGWDTVRSVNYRLPSDTIIGDAYPTLTDLYEKVNDVVNRLGYEARVTSDIKAALMTRLNGLRIGGKGIMLDTQKSVPMSELLAKPTIIELEEIGDDDEKAFVMGLLLVRLYEYLRAHGSTEGTALRHVVVIEEAHRLLANVPLQANQEYANIRGKAVETFANMLSEVRAYGEGFIVAEQIPSKLSSDVIKNTNLKVVHRIVAGDDRYILGQTMNMKEEQHVMLSTFRTGKAAVFAEGDDIPILVEVPYAKIEVPSHMKAKKGSDRTVKAHMEGFRTQKSIAPLYVPFGACSQVCKEPFRYCADAKEIVSRKDFQEQFTAFVLSVVAQGTIDDIYSALLTYVRSRIPQRWLNSPEIANCVLLNAIQWYFTYFGRRHNWPYTTVDTLKGLLSSIVLKPGSHNSEEIVRFQTEYKNACRRLQDQFPACPVVCPSGDCLFHYHTELLLYDHRLTELFNAGMAKAGSEAEWRDVRALNQVIARLARGVSRDTQRSVGLCYGVQQITYKPGLLEQARNVAIDKLICGVDALVAPAEKGGST